MLTKIWTIGHSNLTETNFINLLRIHQIEVVADIRSTPFSRFAPQFNQADIRASLQNAEIQYIYLGDTLGGRSSDDLDYIDNQVQYSSLRNKHGYLKNIEKVINIARSKKLALMCTEKNPLDCHRSILVSRDITKLSELEIIHILDENEKVSQSELINGILRSDQKIQFSLFEENSKTIEEILEKYEKKIAFKRSSHNTLKESH